MADTLSTNAGSNNLASLLSLLNGGNSSTTKTSTKSNMTAEGVQALLDQIMSGTQGLASVASGQRSAGLYNSTTNQQLVNDLATRASAQVAANTAGTTTTQTVKGAGNSPAQMLALLSAGNKLLSSDIGKKGVSAVSDLFGLGSSGSTAIAADGLPVASTNLASVLSGANATADPLGAFVSALGYDGGGTTAATSLSAGSAAVDAGLSGAAVGASGIAAGTTAAELGTGAVLADAGLGAAGSVAGAAGLDAAALLGTSTAGEAAVGAGLAGAGELGALGAVGAGLGTAIPILGAGLAAYSLIDSWVICTELHAQNKLPTELYQASAQRALKLAPEIIAGYHFWAVPLTRVMRKSRILSAILAPIARSRCEYLLGEPRIWGWMTVKIGEPLCYVMGKLINGMQSDWRKLYGRT